MSRRGAESLRWIKGLHVTDAWEEGLLLSGLADSRYGPEAVFAGPEKQSING